MLFGEERTLGQKLQEDQCSAFTSVFKCLEGPYVEMGLYLWWGGVVPLKVRYKTEDEMVGWYHQLNGHEFEQTLGDGEGQGNLVCCSS